MNEPDEEAFTALVLRYLDGQASPEEGAFLNRKLSEDEECRNRVVSLCRLHGHLAEVAAVERQKAVLSEGGLRKGPTVRSLSKRPARSHLGGGRNFVLPAFAAAGLAAALLLAVTLSSPGPTRPLRVGGRDEAGKAAGARPERADGDLRRAEERLREIRQKERELAVPPPAATDSAAEQNRREQQALLKAERENIEREMKERVDRTPKPELEIAKPPREPEKEPSSPISPPPKPSPQETRATVATLGEVAGEVFVVSDPEPSRAVAGRPLLAGEGLETAGAGSWAVVQYSDGTRLTLGPGSLVKGFSDAAGKRLDVERGTLTAKVVKQPVGKPLVFATPQGEATVLGTTLRLTVDATSTRLEVTEGKVRLKRVSDGKAVEVASGHVAVAAVGVDLAPRPVLDGRKPVLIELEAFGNARGTKPAAGLAKRLALEADPTASGGVCVAAPGAGTEVTGDLALAPGPWYVWLRYRNEEVTSITFTVLVDQRVLGDVTTPGGDSKWLWKRFEFQAAGAVRLVLRSTYDGLPDPKRPGKYDAVNRWDLICLTRDERFSPQ